MKPQKIRLFVKPMCGWCHEAMHWLDDHGWEYEKLNVWTSSKARQEMQELTGQGMAPSIDVDGHILADFDTGQLEQFLKQHGYDF